MEMIAGWQVSTVCQTQADVEDGMIGYRKGDDAFAAGR
jgi:hypothetical protein